MLHDKKFLLLFTDKNPYFFGFKEKKRVNIFELNFHFLIHNHTN